MNLSDLDELLRGANLPIRPETLEIAWDLTDVEERTRQVLLLVTMHARPGAEERLEKASREFLVATGGLTGSRGSTLHRSAEDPRTWFLLERFATEDSLARHMASDYFAQFRAEQATLLAEPVTAWFLERGV